MISVYTQYSLFIYIHIWVGPIKWTLVIIMTIITLLLLYIFQCIYVLDLYEYAVCVGKCVY